jgi:response regulator RpfG family c-di-GMP phosphodiesterase
MFLDNGFNGYISKPIDMRELNRCLNRMVRDKQTPETIEAARKSMERQKVVYTSKRRENEDNELKKMALRDIEKALAVLDELMTRIDSSSEADMKLFTTTVHGMKVTFLHINETDLSIESFKLEQAGEKSAIFEIFAEAPKFIDAAKQALEKHKLKKADTCQRISAEEITILRENLAEIKKACSRIKKSAARASLDIIRKIVWPSEVNDMLDEIAAHLLHGEFKKAAAVVDKTMEMLANIPANCPS